ncbi:uncharacterized protein LOC128230772 [Mya arenaria]|uniref:uncharacterized protein LOC128230772 n=1 Tax=Mya arenaria TaxID=6604 RepID=UPI0022E05B36|nr:uncharacterized protein LOC128230772 [Mya arenaria]
MDEVPGKKLQADASDLDVTYCQPCSQDGETIPAEAYCTVCKEFMCSNCTSVHKKQRLTKSHILLDKNCMPTSIRGFTSKEESKHPCDIHPEECIKYFCPTHQSLNCGHCSVLDHKSCKQQIITKIANDFKEDQSYKAIQLVIDQLLKDIDACASVATNNTKLAEYLEEHGIAKIRIYRDQINKYFDEREKTLLETIAEMKNMDEILLDSLKLKCVNLKTQVSDIKAKLAANESNTTQLFIEAHISKNLLEGLQLELAEINKKNTIQQYQFRNDNAIESLLGSKNCLGTIEMVDTSKDRRCERQCSATRNEGKKNTATSDAATNVKAVMGENVNTADSATNVQGTGDIQANQTTQKFSDSTVPGLPLNPVRLQTSATQQQIKQTIASDDLTSPKLISAPDILVKSLSDTKNCDIKYMLILPGDRLLLTDSSNGAVKLVDLKVSSLVTEVSVPGWPRGMCHISGDRIAVSLGYNIQFLEITGHLSLGKNIKVDGDCHDVGYHNGNLIVSFESGKVEKINMEGLVMKKVSTKWYSSRPFKKPLYLKIVSDEQTAAIYVSDFGKNTITMMDMNLNILETFKDPALFTPAGFTAVGNQLIICSLVNFNIMRLDLSSGQMTELLGTNELKMMPRCVCYCQQQNKMYVAFRTRGDAENYVKVFNTTSVFC